MIGLGLPHVCFTNKLSSCTVSEIEPVRTIENKALTFFLAFLDFFFSWEQLFKDLKEQLVALVCSCRNSIVLQLSADRSYHLCLDCTSTIFVSKQPLLVSRKLGRDT